MDNKPPFEVGQRVQFTIDEVRNWSKEDTVKKVRLDGDGWWVLLENELPWVRPWRLKAISESGK